MFTPYLKMIVPLALIASNRFILVGVQGVGAPAAQVQLGRWRPLVHEEHLPRGDVVPPGAEFLARGHVGVSFHCVEGEVERVVLQHSLEPPQVWVKEDHPIPLFLNQASRDDHQVLVLGSEDVLTGKIGPYLHFQVWMLSLEHCDDLVRATLLLQAPQLKPGPWRILVLGKGGTLVSGDSGPFLILVILLLLLLLFASKGQVISEWRTRP